MAAGGSAVAPLVVVHRPAEHVGDPVGVDAGRPAAHELAGPAVDAGVFSTDAEARTSHRLVDSDAHTSSVATCAASTVSNRPTVVIGDRPGGSSSRT